MRIARERELGAVRIIEAGFGIDVGKPDQWRLKHALSGGGALMDVGVMTAIYESIRSGRAVKL